MKVCECGESRAPVLRQQRGSGLGSGQVDLSSVAFIHKTASLKSKCEYGTNANNIEAVLSANTAMQL